MKLISSLIASCLAFTYGQDNTTDIPMDLTSSTEAMESTSTTMYTSQVIAYETVPYDSADDPTNDFEDCDYYFMATLDDLDDISVYICGYTGEDEIGYTEIKLDIPSNRWVIFGMKSDGDVSGTDTFANYDGYNIGIPIDNQNYDPTQEFFFMPNKEGIELASTITVVSDMINANARRILRLLRAETITETAINDTGLDDNRTASDIVDYYFDFEDFSACDDISRLSVTYGPINGARLQATGDKFTQDTYGNRKAVSVTIDEVGGYLCGDDGDDAPQQFINIFVAVIIGIVAMLF